MIATIHFRGDVTEERSLPGLPAVGHYVRHAGALWRIDAVVADAVPDVYAARVGDCRASELTAAWAAWGDDETQTVASSIPRAVPQNAGKT